MDSKINAMMIYKCGRNAINAVDKFDEAVEFLSQIGSTRPVTAREIGLFAYGNAYYYSGIKQRGVDRSKAVHVSQILRHLCKSGIIKAVEIDGEPITITHEKLIECCTYTVPKYVGAYDSEGHYLGMIANPKYDPVTAYHSTSRHWETVTEIITPKIKAYTWAEEK